MLFQNKLNDPKFPKFKNYCENCGGLINIYRLNWLIFAIPYPCAFKRREILTCKTCFSFLAEEHYIGEPDPWDNFYTFEFPGAREAREEMMNMIPAIWEDYQWQLLQKGFSAGELRPEFNPDYLINTPWWKEPSKVTNATYNLIEESDSSQ